MKKNGFLDRMNREKEKAMIQTHRFTRQLMVDLSYVALNKSLGLGAERLKKYANALQEVYSEYADLWNSDEKETEYSRAALDAKLRQIFGEDFHPWEVRYDSN